VDAARHWCGRGGTGDIYAQGNGDVLGAMCWGRCAGGDVLGAMRRKPKDFDRLGGAYERVEGGSSCVRHRVVAARRGWHRVVTPVNISGSGSEPRVGAAAFRGAVQLRGKTDRVRSRNPCLPRLSLTIHSRAEGMEPPANPVRFHPARSPVVQFVPIRVNPQ
jgi:hypothetical protein